MTRERAQLNDIEDGVVIEFDHAALADVSLTKKLFKVPAGKRLKITGVDYINPTGLAESATDFAVLEIKNGSTVMAGPRSTETGVGSSIAADTHTALALSATPANLIAAASDVISFVATETGTTTIPAGRVVITGRYI